MKNFLISIIVIALLGFGVYFITSKPNAIENDTIQNQETTAKTTEEIENETSGEMIVEKNESNQTESILGKSAGGRDIPVYKFGNGDTKILFIGGVHGGYAWNTSLLTYEIKKYLEENPEVVPSNITVTVIPVLNPDGLAKVTKDFAIEDLSNNPPELSSTIEGRFNANDVDLNRNFDCNWQEEGTWQNRTVSGGNEAFSKPESQAIKNYIESEKPTAVIVWYSAAGGIFSSSCNDKILEEAKNLTKIYAVASNYSAYDEFNSYEVTGDMVNWLAKKEIPAISVLLTNHKDIEWNKNKAGIEAILNYYAK